MPAEHRLARGAVAVLDLEELDERPPHAAVAAREDVPGSAGKSLEILLHPPEKLVLAPQVGELRALLGEQPLALEYPFLLLLHRIDEARALAIEGGAALLELPARGRPDLPLGGETLPFPLRLGYLLPRLRRPSVELPEHPSRNARACSSP